MKKIIIFTILISFLTYSCSDDFIDAQLEQNEEIKPLSTLEELQTFMNGTYALMRNKAYYGGDFVVFGEVRGSDQMYTTGITGRMLQIGGFSERESDAYVEDTWRAIYRVIANANIVIHANISSSTRSTDPIQLEKSIKDIKAQAHAIRALAYFDLIKLYGQKYTQDNNLGVPLVLENPQNAITFKPARATLEECYAQIEADFELAYNQITASGAGTFTLTKEGISGLMSRYYLWKEDYVNAYKYAQIVTSNSSLEPISLGSYGISWDIRTLNSIFELAYGVAGSPGTNSIAYMLRSDGYANVRLLNDFVASFEVGDIRASRKTISSPYGMIRANQEGTVFYLEGKYPNLLGENNQKIVRYEEVALNQAEAILMGGGGTNDEALELINKIRTQRGVPVLVGPITLEAVRVERGKELVGEGFRAWDLLRWNKTLTPRNREGTPSIALPVGDYRLTFPIPQAERDANPDIIQNKRG